MGLVGFGDLDRDGLADVVAPTMGAHVEALRGMDGARLWRAEVDGGSRCGPTVEDVTGDGVLDVVVCDHAGGLHAIRGRGRRR